MEEENVQNNQDILVRKQPEKGIRSKEHQTFGFHWLSGADVDTTRVRTFFIIGERVRSVIKETLKVISQILLLYRHDNSLYG